LNFSVDLNNKSRYINKMNNKDKIKLIEELLFELKDKMERGEMSVEDEGSYENFIYNLKDLILDL